MGRGQQDDKIRIYVRPGDAGPVLSPALKRALRDIDDGHLTLWGYPDATPDRPVAGLADGWWIPLQEQGLLEPVKGSRPFWRLSDRGRLALHGLR